MHQPATSYLAAASPCGPCPRLRTAVRAFVSNPSQALAKTRSSQLKRHPRTLTPTTTAAVAESVAHSMEVPAVTPCGEKLMNIVFVSAEITPWSKTGGLADVCGSLPVELAKRGHNVFTIAPRYDQYWDAWDTDVTLTIDGETVRFFHTVKGGVHRVWVDHPWFLSKVWGLTGSKLYGPKSGADYVDNQRRFSLLCKAAIESLTALPFMPGEDAVLVANDWHASLIPILLKDVYQPSGRFVNTPAALCIHNIAFQGRFWPESFAQLGLPEASRARFAFEDGYPTIFDETSPVDESVAAPGQRFSKINWLRAGISACDKLLTVSPHYATEIASGPQLGVELDDVIRAKGVEGIVNGMDVADWNPALDKFLSFKYNAESVEAGKAFAKAALQREVGLPVTPSTPLFGFIGRLEEQKGVDILIASLDKLPANAQVQVVVLGTGKVELEAQVRNLAARYPGVAVGVAQFNNPLAHLITAGADYMLIPSRFEPCGLIQLHAMSYGTVPVVASTGGLVDTVKEGVTGFQMGAMNPDALTDGDAEAVAATIARAAEVYGTQTYSAMRDACIAQDLSWALPAKKWEAVLAELKYGNALAEKAAEQKAEVPTPVVKLDSPGSYPDAPGPKPADVAAAIAAPKLKSSASTTSTVVSPAAAAAAAATVSKSSTAAMKKKTEAASFVSSRTSAAAAAKATVADAPAPVPPPSAATTTTVAASKVNTNGNGKVNGSASPSPVASKGNQSSVSTSTVSASKVATKNA